MHTNKTFLDQLPELYTTLHLYLDQLDLDIWGAGSENWINELECRRRDGFIPHSHNHGGFDVYNCHSTELTCDCEKPETCECEETLILHGFRLMFEGSEAGIYTLCIYYSQWTNDDVYGMNRSKTLAQAEIRFRTIEGLISKLDQFINRTLAA